MFNEVFYNKDLAITVKLDLCRRWKEADAQGTSVEDFVRSLGHLERKLFPRRRRFHITDAQLRLIASTLARGMPLDDVKYLRVHWLRLRRASGKQRAGRAASESENIGNERLGKDFYALMGLDVSADARTIRQR